jgi:hypothetical protein
MSAVALIIGDLQCTTTIDGLRTLGQFEPRFRDEAEPTDFFSLVEWYAIVMFPNFQETMRLAKNIRRASRVIERRFSPEEISAAGPFVLRGLELAGRADDLHNEMAALDDWVIEAERLSHTLSDKLETINGGMHFILKYLRNMIERRETGLDQGSVYRPDDGQ